jgi:hypothetical protein
MEAAGSSGQGESWWKQRGDTLVFGRTGGDFSFPGSAGAGAPSGQREMGL